MCAGVSMLWGALAASLQGREDAVVRDRGDGQAVARARETPETAAQFALVWAGLRLLAESYPAHVEARRLW